MCWIQTFSRNYFDGSALNASITDCIRQYQWETVSPCSGESRGSFWLEMLQVWHCGGVENQKSQVLLETGVNAHGCSCLTTRVRSGDGRMQPGCQQVWQSCGRCLA